MFLYTVGPLHFVAHCAKPNMTMSPVVNGHTATTSSIATVLVTNVYLQPFKITKCNAKYLQSFYLVNKNNHAKNKGLRNKQKKQALCNASDTDNTCLLLTVFVKIITSLVSNVQIMYLAGCKDPPQVSILTIYKSEQGSGNSSLNEKLRE